MNSFREMFHRLFRVPEQSRAARTVELYGWFLMLEGLLIMTSPSLVASLLRFAPLAPPAANFLRLAGVLVAGIGMLYTISGRMNAEGFVFASLLDRPLVPPVAGLLWYFGFLPGPLALLFAMEDFGSWLWTFLTWRADLLRPS